VRADFPILAVRNSHGRPLVYLDSAATSLKPASVIEAVNGYNREYSANIHRGIYEIAQRAAAAYEGARGSVANLLGAKADEVVFVRNATEAINLVAYSWGRHYLKEGDLIVLTEMEHHANLVPWQVLAAEKGLRLEFVPLLDGRLDQEVFANLLAQEPKLVAFTHVSNMLGTINPVGRMTAAAHSAGARVLIDGAQAVPHMSVDVIAIGADFYVFSGHKALGPTGSGVLWGRREILEAMPPFLTGGEMIKEVSLRTSTYADVPGKFEAGTPDIAAAIGLGAAARYLMALDMCAVRAHEQALTNYALGALVQEVPGIEIYGPGNGARGGVISFNLPGIHPHDVAEVLDRSGVAVRAGHHCAMPLHAKLGLAASARASFGVYSTRQDVDALIAGLREVQRIFKA